MKQKYLIPMTALSMLLASCSHITGNDGKTLAQMTFEHVKPFPVYVASYETTDLNETKAINLPEGFVTNPSSLIYDYLNNRFEAAGNQGKLMISVDDVHIQHAIEKSDNAVGSVIGLGKKDHYHIKAFVSVEGRGIGQYERLKRNLVVTRNIFISEHVSLIEREQLEMQALDSMIDDLDIALRKVLNEQFGVLR
ncbi:MAG: hypothetical protein ACTHOO_06485 [Alcanivorax sp.]